MLCSIPCWWCPRIPLSLGRFMTLIWIQSPPPPPPPPPPRLYRELCSTGHRHAQSQLLQRVPVPPSASGLFRPPLTYTHTHAHACTHTHTHTHAHTRIQTDRDIHTEKGGGGGGGSTHNSAQTILFPPSFFSQYFWHRCSEMTDSEFLCFENSMNFFIREDAFHS